MEKAKPTLKDMPDILTLKQACEILNCHANTLRKWDDSGYLKAIRFGARKDRRYRKEDIEKFIKSNGL